MEVERKEEMTIGGKYITKRKEMPDLLHYRFREQHGLDGTSSSGLLYSASVGPKEK